MSQPDKVLVRLDLDHPRYDQSTYFGRFRHFLDITDMRTLFTTNEELLEAKLKIKEYKSRNNPPVSLEEAEELWKAKKVVSAIIHQDTGKEIFPLFRLSCFVPANLFITAGLLKPNPSTGSVILWQFINQSYNLALNHANRNASNELKTSTIAMTYGAAVVISCGVAVGLGNLVKNASSFSPTMRTNIQRFVPYSAVAIAGVANVFMMRWNELRDGITIRDAKGNDLGKSPIAGFYACSQVAISRCLSSLPCLTIPPFAMAYLEKTAWLKKNPQFRTPINLGIISILLWSALPAAVAIFPQEGSIPVSRLESSHQNIKNGDRVYFNRGL